MNRRMLNVLLGAALGVIAVAGYVAWTGYTQSSQATRSLPPGVPAFAKANVGGPFEVVDHGGRTVTHEDFLGQYTVYYFGFTFCPDVCPTELSVIASAVDLLGDAAEQVQPVFVTIDPERDTPEMMADYVDLFHPRMIGLTGSMEQVAELANQFRVYYQKVEDDDFQYYLMDHTSFIYVMDPNGENAALVPPGTTADQLAAFIRSQLDAQTTG